MHTTEIEIQRAPVRPCARAAIPDVLADVALIDGPTCAAAGGMSLSQWHERVRAEDAPQPVIRESRFTRWSMAEVRTWLIERVAKAAANTKTGEAVVDRAIKASRAAQQRGRSAKAMKPGTPVVGEPPSRKSWREAIAKRQAADV